MAKGHKTGGRQKGVANKLSGDVRGMILAALDGAGGADYLQKQASANPAAFMVLIGKVLPMQVTGADGGPIAVTSYVVRAPNTVESAEDWLKLYAPKDETET